MLRHSREALMKRDQFIEDMLQIKKARLIEHNMTNEDLIQCQNFSNDEQTLEYIKIRVGEL